MKISMGKSVRNIILLILTFNKRTDTVVRRQAASPFGGKATEKLPGLMLQILFASNEKISVLRYYFTFMGPGIMGTSLLTMITFRVRDEFIIQGMFSSSHILWYTDLLLSEICEL